MFTISHPTDRPNFTEVQVGDLTVWFSYRTPVAFHTPASGTVVRENDWSNTTGRHLSHIDGGTTAARKARLSGSDFLARLNAFEITANGPGLLEDWPSHTVDA